MSSMSRPILVGEAPAGVGLEPLPALDGRVGSRLAEMAGLTREEYRERFDLRNLFESPDEGVPWRHPEAVMRAIRLLMTVKEGDRVVCLGNRVAEAFGLLRVRGGLPYYEWRSARKFGDLLSREPIEFSVARVPHPSGRNRVLNDPDHRVRMSAFLRECLE